MNCKISSEQIQLPKQKYPEPTLIEWLPGEFFLLHKADVVIGDNRSETFEIIGFDNDKNLYTMQQYNNKGDSGFMTADCKNGVWRFLGENLRFSGGFRNGDQEFSGIWEQSSDGKNWQHFMDIGLTK